MSERMFNSQLTREWVANEKRIITFIASHLQSQKCPSTAEKNDPIPTITQVVVFALQRGLQLESLAFYCRSFLKTFSTAFSVRHEIEVDKQTLFFP